MAYVLSHPSTGMVVNLYSTSQTGAVANGTRLLLYSWQNNNDQKWTIETVGNPVILRLARDSNKVLNRHSTNNNAHVWNYDGSAATKLDSLIDTETTNGNTRIKLVGRGLYLTKNAGDNYLSWTSKTETNRQYFKLVDEMDYAGSGGGDTSSYGYPTTSRTTKGGFIVNGHTGLDITGPLYTEIKAICDGVVAYSQNATKNWHPDYDTASDNEGSLSSMGNCIVINSINPNTSLQAGTYMRSIYMHLKDAPSLKPNAVVKKGQPIGIMGNTGRSTGDHLHFTLAVGNNSNMAPNATGWVSIGSLPLINPKKYFPDYK